MSAHGVAAGWFATRRRGTVRWWDGTTWTEHIAVRGRETTLTEENRSLRRQLVLTEIVLAAVLVGSIVIAFWGGLPVIVVRPVIVAVGVTMIALPFLISQQLRLAAQPARRSGIPPLR